MRFATVLASILAIAASSALAAPIHDSHTRGYEGNAVVARDLTFVARDVVHAVHPRELEGRTL